MPEKETRRYDLDNEVHKEFLRRAISRRQALSATGKIGAAAAVAAIVAGAGGYLAGGSPGTSTTTTVTEQVAGQDKTVTKTVEIDSTKTVTKDVEKTVTQAASECNVAPGDRTLIKIFSEAPAANNAFAESVLEDGKYCHIDLQTGLTGGEHGIHRPTLMRKFGTNDPPDLFSWWCAKHLEEIVTPGFVEDISDVWESHKSDYPSACYQDNITVFNGKNYGTPAQLSYEVAVYNVPLFKELGIKAWPKTWDGFMNDVIQPMKDAGVQHPWGGNYAAEWVVGNTWQQLCLGLKGPEFYARFQNNTQRFDDPETVEVFKFWHDLIADGVWGENPEKTLGHGHDSLPPLYKEGKVGLVILPLLVIANWWPDMANADELAGFLVPTDISPSQPANMALYYIWPYSAGAGGPPARTEAAKDFLDWFLTPKGAEIHNKYSGLLNPNKRARPEFTWHGYLDVVAAVEGNYAGYQGSWDVVGNRWWEHVSPDEAIKTDQAMQQMYKSRDPDYKKVAADCQKVADDVFA